MGLGQGVQIQEDLIKSSGTVYDSRYFKIAV
jgi:hypothetical protein